MRLDGAALPTGELYENRDMDPGRIQAGDREVRIDGDVDEMETPATMGTSEAIMRRLMRSPITRPRAQVTTGSKARQVTAKLTVTKRIPPCRVMNPTM